MKRNIALQFRNGGFVLMLTNVKLGFRFIVLEIVIFKLGFMPLT